MTKENATLTNLYTIHKNAKCVKCGNIGAVQSYGTHNSATDKISHTLGYGGTVPYRCLNCGNTGMIGFGGLEGYKKAFNIIQNSEVKS